MMAFSLRDTDDVGAPLDFPAGTFEWVRAVQLGTVLRGEAHIASTSGSRISSDLVRDGRD
jgi:hypothetical protein